MIGTGKGFRTCFDASFGVTHCALVMMLTPTAVNISVGVLVSNENQNVVSSVKLRSRDVRGEVTSSAWKTKVGRERIVYR